MSKRIFIISYRDCLGPIGGPSGVNFKLYQTNIKYKLLKNNFHIFKDVIIYPGQKKIRYTSFDKSSNKKNIYKIKKYIKNNHILSKIYYLIKYNLQLIKIYKFAKLLNKKFSFNNSDVFIFHDVETAYVFYKIFKNIIRNTLLVYHQQGSLYSEWNSFTNLHSTIYKNYLNKVLYKTIKNVKFIGFPSNGSKDMLIKTQLNLKGLINLKGYYLFYNGYDKNICKKTVSKSMNIVINKVKNYNLSFTTVANLNNAKAVERIPLFLSKIKKKYKNFIWILIGDGINSSKVANAIDNNEINDNVIWIKKRLNHIDIISLFNYTNFYILFHKFSIFDFATIEAMAHGNIPILSNVGGNKEMIIDNNGILLDSFDSINSFEELIHKYSLDFLKKKNEKIQKENFSSQIFLENYMNFINDKFN